MHQVFLQPFGGGKIFVCQLFDYAWIVSAFINLKKHRIIEKGYCKFIIEKFIMKYGILRKNFEVDWFNIHYQTLGPDLIYILRKLFEPGTF